MAFSGAHQPANAQPGGSTAPSKTTPSPALVLPSNVAPSGTAAAPEPIKTQTVRVVRTVSAAKRRVTIAAQCFSTGVAMESQPVESTPAGVTSTGAIAVGRVVQNATSTPIKGEVAAQKVVIDAQGKERFEPAVNLQDGDLIQFNATFTNLNPMGIRFDPQLSVPANTQLVPGSIRPPQGRVVRVANSQAVAWSVPDLPPMTWVGASIRVRYVRPEPATEPAANNQGAPAQFPAAAAEPLPAASAAPAL